MSESVSDFIVRRMAFWGVRGVFGYPGDGSNGLMGAFNRGKHEIEFIQTRHEELAAFMASAHAKFTGEVGVCAPRPARVGIAILQGTVGKKVAKDTVSRGVLGALAALAIDRLFGCESSWPSLKRALGPEGLALTYAAIGGACAFTPARSKKADEQKRDPSGSDIAAGVPAM